MGRACQQAAPATVKQAAPGAYHAGSIEGPRTMANLPVPPECLQGSSPQAGLDSTQVDGRRRQFGPNDVTETRQRPWWAVVAASAADPMPWFLLPMGVLFFARGDTTRRPSCCWPSSRLRTANQAGAVPGGTRLHPDLPPGSSA